MPVTVTCPACDSTSVVGEDILGKKIRCKKCQEVFVAEGRPAKVGARGDDRLQKANGRAAPPPLRRSRVDDDDEPVAVKRKPGKKAAGGSMLVPLLIGGGVFGLLGIAGAVGAYVMLKGPSEDGGPKAVVLPPPLVTTPEVAAEGEKPKDEGEKPKTVQKTEPTKGVYMAGMAAPQPRPMDMRGEVREEVKKSAVLIRTKSADGGGDGSGWCAEPGIIVTNAHVVGMKEPTAPPPDRVEIYAESGTPNERMYTGKILGLDRENDLCILQIKGANLPPPLTIVPSSTLGETQKIYVMGFPYGSMLGGRMGERGAKNTLKIRQSTVTGRMHRKDNSVKYVQIEGAAEPGNSGGAIVDTNGHVNMILVAGIPGTTLRFTIPSEYAVYLLQGRMLAFNPMAVTKTDSGALKLPIAAEVADPMKRIDKAFIEVWTGNPSDKPRSYQESRPRPDVGDGPIAVAPLTFDHNERVALGEGFTAKSLVDLPPLPAGKVYWMRPKYIQVGGKERWGEGVVLDVNTTPVDPKPVTFKMTHPPSTQERSVMVESNKSSDISFGGGSRPSNTSLVAKFTEKTRSVDKDGAANIQFKYSDLRLADKDTDEYYRGQLRGMLESAKGLLTDVKLEKNGLYGKPRADMANIAANYRPIMEPFNNQLVESIGLVGVFLPEGEVKPGEPWKHDTPLSLSLTIPVQDEEGRGRLIRRTENALYKMRYTLLGTRTRNGREEAVVVFEGKVGKDDSQGSAPTRGSEGDDDHKKHGIGGVAYGSALVDIQTGYVTHGYLYTHSYIAVEIQEGQGLEIGSQQTVNLRRTLGKDSFDKPASPESLLPNVVRQYNPHVGTPGSVAGPDVAIANEPTTLTQDAVHKAMKPDVEQRVKNAAAMIKVKHAEGDGSGSGWFTGEKGIVVTNAHVVGMKNAAARPPKQVEVVCDSGLPTERTYKARILALDREEDLCVLKVDGDNIPEPLQTSPSADLVETQRVATVGFPHGGNLAQEMGGGLDQNRTTLRIRQTVFSGRVIRANGFVKAILIENAVDPGNSGGAVVDMDGRVRSVVVAVLLDDRAQQRGAISGISITIPVEYAQRIVDGHVDHLRSDYPYYDDDRKVRAPIRAIVMDPLNKVSNLQLEVWTGPSGPTRLGGATPPRPIPGESARVSAPMAFDRSQKVDAQDVNPVARVDFEMPPLPAGQVYWTQVKYTNGTGKTVWGDAQEYSMRSGGPVERKATVLNHRNVIRTNRFVDLTTSVEYNVNLLARTSEQGDAIKTTLLEEIVSVDANQDAQVRLTYHDFVFRGYDPRDPRLNPRSRQLLLLMKQAAKGIVSAMKITRTGEFRNPKTDLSRLPPQGQALMYDFNEQILSSLKVVSFPLPNKKVEYNDKWSVKTNLLIEGQRRARSEAGLFELTYTYKGVRDAGGRQEAIIEIDGNLTRDPNAKDGPAMPESKDEPTPEEGTVAPTRQPTTPKLDITKARGLYGKGKGLAFVDLANGVVSYARLTVDFEVEVPSKEGDKVTAKTTAQMNLLLERRTGAR